MQKTYPLERRAGSTARPVAGTAGRKPRGDGGPEQEPVRVLRHEAHRHGGIENEYRVCGEKCSE